MTPDEQEKLARKRFMLLSVTRFASVAFVMLGIANLGGQLFPLVMPYLGYALLVIGVLEFFMIPIMLKKIWARQDATRG
jgi:hypothetical protein